MKKIIIMAAIAGLVPGSVQSMDPDTVKNAVGISAATLFSYSVLRHLAVKAEERDARRAPHNEQRASVLFAAFDACKKFETGSYSQSWDRCLRAHGAKPDDVQAARTHLWKKAKQSEDYSVLQQHYKSMNAARYFFDSIFK